MTKQSRTPRAPMKKLVPFAATLALGVLTGCADATGPKDLLGYQSLCTGYLGATRRTGFVSGTLSATTISLRWLRAAVQGI